jgi:hypothetical protein
MQLADRIIVVGIAVAGLYGLALLPLVPLLGSSHPALLELVRGSTASIINMAHAPGSDRRRSRSRCCWAFRA